MSYFYVKPQIDPWRRKVEQINELLTSIMVYHLLIFSDFQPDLDLSFNAGYSFCFFLIMLILANFLNMIMNVIHSL